MAAGKSSFDGFGIPDLPIVGRVGQATFICTSVVLLFLVFITARGSLGQYIRLLV